MTENFEDLAKENIRTKKKNIFFTSNFFLSKPSVGIVKRILYKSDI